MYVWEIIKFFSSELGSLCRAETWWPSSGTWVTLVTECPIDILTQIPALDLPLHSLSHFGAISKNKSQKENTSTSSFHSLKCYNLAFSPTLSAPAVKALKMQLVLLCGRECSVLPHEHVDCTSRGRGLAQGPWPVFSKTGHVLLTLIKQQMSSSANSTCPFINNTCSCCEMPAAFLSFHDRRSLMSPTTS